MMNTIQFHIRGISPLVMHNERLADPLNTWSQEIGKITSKQKKTDADHREIGRLEWIGGMYLSDIDSGHPVVPPFNFERMFRDAAIKQKKGKDVQAGLSVSGYASLIYDGPKDIEKMWSKAGKYVMRRSVKVRNSRVIRTRPKFDEWELKFEVSYDEDILNESSVRGFLDYAGAYIGLGNWRPRYGRFEVL